MACLMRTASDELHGPTQQGTIDSYSRTLRRVDRSFRPFALN